MARQDGWRNDERRYEGESRRDWRAAGDDWRSQDSGRIERGERRFGERRPGRGEGFLDEIRRRDNAGQRGGDYGFARSESDADYGRSTGMFADERPGVGAGHYDRDIEWGGYPGDYRRSEGYGSPRDSYRSRSYGEDRWSDRGRSGEERGFLDRAADEVSSWFGDRDAERRREEDQFRGKGPKGYTRSDERIREDVSDRLTDDPFVDASDIEISVSSSEVTLSGTVATREQRRRAEDVAERISGIRHVQNNLRVAERSSNIGQTAFGRDTSTGELGTGGTASAPKSKTVI